MFALHHMHEFVLTRWFQTGQQRVINQAIRIAYTRWAKQHPEWVVAFFDEHFVTQRAAPLLNVLIVQQRPLDPRCLAERWADQFHFAPTRRQQLIASLMPALANFLALFRTALNNQLNAQSVNHAQWAGLWQCLDQQLPDAAGAPMRQEL
jgi:hypothetical protein